MDTIICWLSKYFSTQGTGQKWFPLLHALSSHACQSDRIFSYQVSRAGIRDSMGRYTGEGCLNNMASQCHVKLSLVRRASDNPACHTFTATEFMTMVSQDPNSSKYQQTNKQKFTKHIYTWRKRSTGALTIFKNQEYIAILGNTEPTPMSSFGLAQKLLIE